MKVLNLGAGGFIGAHLTHRLLDEGHTVTAVDTHNDKILDILGHPHFMYFERDIRHMEFQLDGLVKEADLVIDLIAHANPGIYIKMPLDVFRLNFNENVKMTIKTDKMFILIRGNTSIVIGDSCFMDEGNRWVTWESATRWWRML